MDGFVGKHRSELLEIAQKVFDGRDRKEDLLIRKMGHATVAVPQVPATLNSAHAHHDKRRRPLLKDQFTYCQEMDHWENECSSQKQVAYPPNPSQS